MKNSRQAAMMATIARSKKHRSSRRAEVSGSSRLAVVAFHDLYEGGNGERLGEISGTAELPQSGRRDGRGADDIYGRRPAARSEPERRNAQPESPGRLMSSRTIVGR